METIKYHLLKKKYPKTSPKRGKTFFIAGLPSKDRSPDGKLKYNKMITIHTGNESEARRIAQEELAKIFPTINKENIESQSYICHCDDVRLDEIMTVIGDRKFISVDEVKHTTRLGMGACRGKRCIKRLKQTLKSSGKTGVDFEEQCAGLYFMFR